MATQDKGNIVLVEKQEHIAVITLNNPPLNLMNTAMLHAFETAVRTTDADDDVWVVVLTGCKQKVFCAGSDIREFPAIKHNIIEEKLRRENALFDRVARMRQPVIGAVDGIALGGGMEIALACDFRVLDEEGKLGMPEITLGNFPGSGGLLRLPALIGPVKAQEYISLGTVLSPQEALALGIISKTAPHGETLECALGMARELLKKPPEVLRAIKKGLRASATMSTPTAIEFSVGLYEALLQERCISAW